MCLVDAALAPLVKPQKKRGSKRPAAGPASAAKPAKAAKSSAPKSTVSPKWTTAWREMIKEAAEYVDKKDGYLYEVPDGWTGADVHVFNGMRSWEPYSTALLLAWEWSWVVYGKAGKTKEAKEVAGDLLEMEICAPTREFIIVQLALHNRSLPVKGLALEQFLEEWRNFRVAQGNAVRPFEPLPLLYYNKQKDE